MTLIDKALAEKEALQKELNSIKKSLAHAPDGHLQRHKNGHSFKWYRCIKQLGTNRRKRFYIRKKDHDLIRLLAEKSFYESYLREGLKRIEILERFLTHYPKDSAEVTAMKSLPEWEQPLVGPHRLLNEELTEWQNAPYDINDNYPERRNVSVAGELLVRSKSEAYIASALLAKGIPFRYESKLTLSGQTLYPDFVIRHPRTGAFFIWEHFGLIDRPQYRNRMMSKMHAYIDNGYVPLDNFIITSETSERPLSFSLVDALIDYYFL